MAHVDPNRENPWVLLLDDDRGLAVLLGAFLEKFGLPYRSAGSPEEAAALVKRAVPTLCFVDLNLNDEIDGFTVLRGLRKKFGPSLPLLVISGDGRPESVSRALEAGADDYLVKPIDLEELKAKLRMLIPLDGKAIPAVPFRKPPDGGLRAQIRFGGTVVAAHELGLTVESPHFVSPGAPSFTQCELFQSAFGKPTCLCYVRECEAIGDGSYRIGLEFEALTQEQANAWRRCLLRWGETRSPAEAA
jgi:CheY-like chemotaxis protein